MGIGKAPLIGAADTDVTPVKKNEMLESYLDYIDQSNGTATLASAQGDCMVVVAPRKPKARR